MNFGIDFFSNCNPTKRSAHYFSIIIYWLEIPFWCTSRKAAFEWFIPDLVASMHKIFVIEMDMVKRLGSKGAGVASQYKPCCLQLFFLKQKYFYCLCAMHVHGSSLNSSLKLLIFPHFFLSFIKKSLQFAFRYHHCLKLN